MKLTGRVVCAFGCMVLIADIPPIPNGCSARAELPPSPRPLHRISKMMDEELMGAICADSEQGAAQFRNQMWEGTPRPLDGDAREYRKCEIVLDVYGNVTQN